MRAAAVKVVSQASSTDTTDEEIGFPNIEGTGGSVADAITTGTMRGRLAISASRSLPFQSVKYFGASPCARQ